MKRYGLKNLELLLDFIRQYVNKGHTGSITIRFDMVHGGIRKCTTNVEEPIDLSDTKQPNA